MRGNRFLIRFIVVAGFGAACAHTPALHWDEWFRMSRALFNADMAESDMDEMRGTLRRPDAAVFVIDREEQIVDRVVTFRKDLYPVSK
jgi:hypothetical protein